MEKNDILTGEYLETNGYTRCYPIDEKADILEEFTLFQDEYEVRIMHDIPKDMFFLDIKKDFSGQILHYFHLNSIGTLNNLLRILTNGVISNS